MATPVALRDAFGITVALGAEIGKGGEGTVYDILGHTSKVAKLYLKALSHDHVDKLAAMVALSDPQVLRLAAWPTSTIHDGAGNTVGFIMPKIAGHRPVFQLYGPKLRLQQFPRADWRFLIAAAANTARAFSVIHDAGHVIGDVNHGNLVVSQDATVRLIDCDSFQVTRGSKRWFCEVGVGTHQPPEMQIASYKGVVRTPNQDEFGLAVIIFQLLCMARHPFSGRSQEAGEAPSIEDAIKSYRYAYSRDVSRTRMAAPPSSLKPDAMGPTIEAMFELAFSSKVLRGGRPTALQWSTALHQLGNNLRQCRVNSGHWHYDKRVACPWCEIEAQSGFALFPVTFVGNTAGSSGIALLWQQVSALSDPGPWPLMPSPQSMLAKPSSRATAIRAASRTRRIASIAVIIASLLIAFGVMPAGMRLSMIAVMSVVALSLYKWPLPRDARAFRSASQAAGKDWIALEDQWFASYGGASFGAIRKSLDALKAEHEGLSTERTRRLHQLWEARQQSQMTQHLDSFQIASAKINGISKAKVATLQSCQIFTAADVDPGTIHSTQIPGFGPITKGKLLDWRQACKLQFRFDQSRGVLPIMLAALERDISTRRAKIEADISLGLAQLKAAAASAKLRRKILEDRVNELLPRLAQANADLKAIEGTS